MVTNIMVSMMTNLTGDEAERLEVVTNNGEAGDNHDDAQHHHFSQSHTERSRGCSFFAEWFFLTKENFDRTCVSFFWWCSYAVGVLSS